MKTFFVLASILMNHQTATAGDIKSRVQSILKYAPDREGGVGRKKNEEKQTKNNQNNVDVEDTEE